MKRFSKLGLGVLVLIAAVSAHFVVAQQATPPAAAVPAADTQAKAALESYAKAINDKNLDAIAGFWADAAEHIDDDGVVTKGKADIVAMFKKTLAESPKLSVKLTPTQSRMLGNAVLLVAGVADVKNGEDSDTTKFESLWIRSGNSWQLSRVRELPTDAAAVDSNYDRLKELEWLVGDWTADSAAYSVSTSITWVKNKNFLKIEQVVNANGKESVSVTKVIGYDALRGQLRSWVFDSDGGFGGALIRRSGNTWIDDSEGVTRAGGEATATHTLKFIDDNTFEWTSTDRQLNDKPLPDIKMKYTRKPAAK